MNSSTFILNPPSSLTHSLEFSIWILYLILHPDPEPGIKCTSLKSSVSPVRSNCLFMYASSRERVYTCYLGKYIQGPVVSRRLLTAATWVGTWVKSCGICGGPGGARTDFLRALSFNQLFHDHHRLLVQ
jgi:hypothetical protein